jgi:hypothetical protein
MNRVPGIANNHLPNGLVLTKMLKKSNIALSVNQARVLTGRMPTRLRGLCELPPPFRLILRVP